MLIEIFGLLFCIIIGTIGHFLYEWSGYKRYIGFFFSKNENTWEHMKLGITPILLWTIIELFTGIFDNLFFAKFFSIVIFSVSLMILYYGFKKVLKKNILFIDILIFYISLGLSSVTSIKLLSKSNLGLFLNLFGLIGICFILWIYKKFNKNTPNWFIFKNPI